MGLICLTTLAYAGDNATHHNHGAAKNATQQERQWETDAPLRQGMDHIRQAMAASRESIVKERLGAKDYQRLAETVDASVSAIIKNCKLGEEADKAFHAIVLADLIRGTELMRASPKTQVRRAGALAVMQSLKNYGTYFRHPGWSVDFSN